MNSGTETTRTMSEAQSGLASPAASSDVTSSPRNSAGDEGVADASGRAAARARGPAGGSGVRTASSTPAPATAMPTSCSVAGRSPCANPTITGTAPESAAVGATTLMRPTARPLYSDARPTAPARPPSAP